MTTRRPDDIPAGPRRTSVALALGGGGARGYAHIGILEILDERGYDIVSIAGSSMGALIGGVYAADGLAEFSAWVRTLTHRDVLRMYDLAPTAPGAIRAERIFARVSDILGNVRIEDLPVEFTAVATDLTAGEERWLREGPVDAAVRASVALPGFMTPVVLRGRLLADGGLLNPLPVAPTIAAGADLTVGVVVSGQARTAAEAPAAAARLRSYRRDAVRRTATQVLDNDVVRAFGTRLAALRGAPPNRTPPAIAEEVPAAVFGALPAGLSTLDVMELSVEAVRTAMTRRTLAEHPPDVLITVPRSSCRTLDFHKAEQMIELGRILAVEALDQEEDRSGCAVGEGP